MIVQIQGGTFCDSPHQYRDDAGLWVPSATQVLKLQGLSDYDGVPEDRMEVASIRGSKVHDLAKSHFRYGDVDPSWITEETAGYFDGYLKFLRETGFVPDPHWIEKGIICKIHHMKLGLTPDVFGKIGRDPWLVEIKCTSGVQASWSIQTGLQEMGIHGSNHVGRVRRGALQLFKDGRYKLHPHTDHQTDEQIGIAALMLVYWRMEKGQDLEKRLAA